MVVPGVYEQLIVDEKPGTIVAVEGKPIAARLCHLQRARPTRRKIVGCNFRRR
jgi:hypothetical protein